MGIENAVHSIAIIADPCCKRGCWQSADRPKQALPERGPVSPSQAFAFPSHGDRACALFLSINVSGIYRLHLRDKPGAAPPRAPLGLDTSVMLY